MWDKHWKLYPGPQTFLPFLCSTLQASVYSGFLGLYFHSFGRTPLRLLVRFVVTQKELDALGAHVPTGCPFTNNWLVQQNESPVPLPGIGTKCTQTYSPGFPSGSRLSYPPSTLPGHPTTCLPCPILLTLLLFPFLLWELGEVP